MPPIVSDFLTKEYAATFGFWYLAYGPFVHNFCRGQRKTRFLTPFYVLCEEIALQWPGKKAALVRKEVEEHLAAGDDNGTLFCPSKCWTYREIADDDLYEKVGRAVYPGTLHVFVVTAPLLHPVYFWIWRFFFPQT